MKIPQSFIDDVLSRIDIIEIIEPRITLKKTGSANYQTLCPFHQEKSPSLTISQTKQFYYCFGCKASGNAINFLMAFDKLSFLDALETLAAKAGMAMPEIISNANPEQKHSLNLLEECSQYFQRQYQKHPAAQRYLEKRGLSAEIIARFKLGYSPPGWDNLLKAWQHNPILIKKLHEIGMLAQKNNKYFDHFRQRIIFPIINARGSTIAFGGRSLDQHMPKYLNSPDSTLFHKSHELYGLYQAINFTTTLSNIIVVEGYMDVIALHQHGITQAVATLGTAISPNHLNTLLRYTSELIFCFDGDKAGYLAAWRALEIALPRVNDGVNIRFLFLPNGEDPDSYISKHGVAKFQSCLQQTLPLADFFFQKLQQQTEMATAAGKASLAQKAKKYLEKIPKGIYQQLLYERLSQIIGISLDKITELLPPAVSTPINPITATKSDILAPIRLAISLLLQCPSLLEKVSIPEQITTIKLEGIEILTKIIVIIKQNSKQTAGSLLEYWKEPTNRALLTDLAVQDLLIPNGAWQNELQGALDRIIEISIEEQIKCLFSKGSKEGLKAKEKVLLQELLSKRK